MTNVIASEVKQSRLTGVFGGFLDCFVVTLLAMTIFASLPVNATEDLANGWTASSKITIKASEVNGDLTDFPVYVDLSDLPAVFFVRAKTDGSDIRVTNGNMMSQVPVDIVGVDTVNGTGELWFKASFLDNGSNTDFYLYYGNGDAVLPAENSTYGSQNVWTNNYLGVWHMNEDPSGGSSSILDSTSNSNNGTPNGGMTPSDLVTGKLGKTLDFEGTDDFIDLGSPNYGINGTVTVSLWMKADTDEGALVAQGWNYDGNEYGWISHFGSNNHNNTNARSISWSSSDNSGNYNALIVSQTASVINLGSWHHVELSKNGTNIQIYVDGALVSNGTISRSSIAYTAGTNLRFARATGASYYTGYFDGLLDEIRISSSGRSPEWTQAEYKNQNNANGFYLVDNGTVYPGITALSPLDNATGIEVNSNLVLTFNKEIDIQSGTITIKQTSDDSIVQSLDVTNGSLVTGNGTTTITLDPSSNLGFDTEYYVNIPIATFADNGGFAHEGITNKNSWNFRTKIFPLASRGFGSRSKVTIQASQVNGDLTNFPVYIDLNGMPASFFTRVRSDGADIRVTTENLKFQLPVEVVSIDTNNGTGELWFKADSLSSTTNSEFWIHYGNGDASFPSPSSAYGSQNTWSEGFVGVWHMDQNPGVSKILDSTSNLNNGTPNGTMVAADLVNGQLGRAIDFDGADDFLDFGTPSLGINYTATVSFWMKTDTDGGTIVSQGWNYSGNEYGWVAHLGTNNHASTNAQSISWASNDNSGNYNGGTVLQTNSSVINFGTWYYVVIVKNDDDIKIYIDGTEVKTGTISASQISYNAGETLYIGKNAINDGFYTALHDGLLDEVKISTSTRSVAWIKTEYNNQSSPSTFYEITEGKGGLLDWHLF